MSFFSQKQRMGAAALILAASTILSRLMGLVRDKVISWQFGAGSEADMYFAAFVVPDIINHLLSGGILAITIIPLLSRRFQEDEDDGWRFFSCIFCWMVVASLLVTGAGMLGAEERARITPRASAPLRRHGWPFSCASSCPRRSSSCAGPASRPCSTCGGSSACLRWRP